MRRLWSANGSAPASVLAVALNVYVTTSSLSGTAAVAFGFKVSATGLGARSYSVGLDRAAFGVANNTTLDVYQLLQAVNRKAVNGVLYNGDATLQAQCADLVLIRTLAAMAGWNVVVEFGYITGLLCPSCQTPEENAEAAIHGATLDFAIINGRLSAVPKGSADGRTQR